MERLFILFFINVLFLSGWQLEDLRADSLSDDEAAIALHIKALHNGNSEVREAAAEALRRIIAKYPSGTSNIRSKDSGEACWIEKVSQVKEGMTKPEVVKIIPPLPESADYTTGPTGDVSYRIDKNWIVTIPYRNSDKVISNAKLTKSELLVFVAPPEDYTGTWTTWYVNGQKGHETQYENGRYNGLLAHYYDNGQKWYEQHYTNHVGDGPDTGWYRDGQKAYSGQYRNGKQDGKWTHWFDDGQKSSENNFKDGEFDGFIGEWYENGQMRFEVNYKNGVKHGIEAGWDEQGVLQYKREYKNGRVVDAPSGQSHSSRSTQCRVR
jgi:antitoxin component YwqK of YwqJK toxin-antitoxin module